MLFDKVVIVLCVSTFTISWTRPLQSNQSLTETGKEPFFLKIFSWFTPTLSKSPTPVKKDNVSEASTSKVQAERESTYEKNTLAWSIFNTGYFSEESKSSELASTDVDYIYEESTTRLSTSAAKDFSSEGTSSELRSAEEDYSKDESTTPVVTTTTEDYFSEEASSSELTTTEVDYIYDEPSTPVPTSTTEDYFPEEVSSTELTTTEVDHFFDEPSTSVQLTSTAQDSFEESTSSIPRYILDNEFSNKTVQAPSMCVVTINSGSGSSCVLSYVLVICLCTLALLLFTLCTLFKCLLPISKECQGEDGLKDSDVEFSNLRKDNNNRSSKNVAII